MTKDNASHDCAIAATSGVTPKEPLQTCAAESVPEGWAWKVVPEEATAQMWQAGRSADEHPGDSYCAVWRAMYAASPSPPELHRESQTVGGESDADANSVKTSQAITSGDEGDA